ncbi:MAG: sulfite exporter TauE/SafE family protein [Eubacteriales bacterium]
MLQIIALPVVGFIIGLFIITMGGGGGAFYVGILTGFFNISPAIAASTSLATMIPTTAVGAFSHWKSGNIRLRSGLFMLIGGVGGAVAGSLCSGLLPQSLYTKISGIFLIGLSIQMLFQFLKDRRNNYETTEKLVRLPVFKSILYGALGGAMSGLIGISGSGPIIVGLSVLGCTALQTVGTSVLVLLGVSTTGFLMHLQLGDIDWPLVALLLIGTTTGAFVGPRLLKKIDRKKQEKGIKPILFCLTLGMGILITLK